MWQPSQSTQASHPNLNIYSARNREGRRTEAGDFRGVQALVGGLSDIAAKTMATMAGGVVSKEDGPVVSCSVSFLQPVPNP